MARRSCIFGPVRVSGATAVSSPLSCFSPCTWSKSLSGSSDHPWQREASHLHVAIYRRHACVVEIVIRQSVADGSDMRAPKVALIELLGDAGVLCVAAWI
jgi:hypothetical protein